MLEDMLFSVRQDDTNTIRVSKITVESDYIMYLLARLDNSGMWFVDFQDEESNSVYFDTKEEAVGAIVQNMLGRK